MGKTKRQRNIENTAVKETLGEVEVENSKERKKSMRERIRVAWTEMLSAITPEGESSTQPNGLAWHPEQAASLSKHLKDP